jgi:hypothetical protein
LRPQNHSWRCARGWSLPCEARAMLFPAAERPRRRAERARRRRRGPDRQARAANVLPTIVLCLCQLQAVRVPRPGRTRSRVPAAAVADRRRRIAPSLCRRHDSPPEASGARIQSSDPPPGDARPLTCPRCARHVTRCARRRSRVDRSMRRHECSTWIAVRNGFFGGRGYSPCSSSASI